MCENVIKRSPKVSPLLPLHARIYEQRCQHKSIFGILQYCGWHSKMCDAFVWCAKIRDAKECVCVWVWQRVFRRPFCEQLMKNFLAHLLYIKWNDLGRGKRMMWSPEMSTYLLFLWVSKWLYNNVVVKRFSSCWVIEALVVIKCSLKSEIGLHIKSAI